MRAHHVQTVQQPLAQDLMTCVCNAPYLVESELAIFISYQVIYINYF